MTAVLTETWVSVFPGVLFRYFRVSHGVALSSMVISVQPIQAFPYQSTLAVTSRIPYFSSCRFSFRLCVPLTFRFISGKDDAFEGSW